MRRIFLIVTGLVLGGVVAGAFLLMQSVGRSGAAAWSGSPLEVGLPAPDFALLSHRGDTVSLDTFRNRVTVVFFGFTHCPDVCPGTLASLARAREELGPRGDDLQVLFITVDPARDTPARLEEYLANFDPDFLGLTGEESTIREVATAYGAFFQSREGEEAPGSPGVGAEVAPAPSADGASQGDPHAGHGDQAAAADGYMVDHSARTFVIDRNGELVLTFQPWLEGDGMAGDLARILDR